MLICSQTTVYIRSSYVVFHIVKHLYRNTTVYFPHSRYKQLKSLYESVWISNYWIPKFFFSEKPPVLIYVFPSQNIESGQTINMSCLQKSVTKVHVDNIYWYHNEKELQNASNNILIENVTSKHAGKYKCIAENTAGKSEDVIQITVNCMCFICINEHVFILKIWHVICFPHAYINFSYQTYRIFIFAVLAIVKRS